MIITFYAIITVIFLYVIFYLIIRRINRNKIRDIYRILEGLGERKKVSLSEKILEEEYDKTLDTLIKQDNELNNSLEELQEFRNELEITYNTLVGKSSQLEYSNKILQKRVENLSNLNNLSRNVLSIFILDNIIDIILDAYFILTASKRISIYLWEGNTLINKKVKGPVRFINNREFDEEELKRFKTQDYRNIYEELAVNFPLLEDEKMVVSPLFINEKELGVIFIIEDKDSLLELEKEMISALAIQASIAIHNSKNHTNLLENERISQELTLAANIQKRILPESINKLKGLEIITHFEPAKEIGGDYYDYFIKDDIFSINIADVSGKGVPAAFLMALARSVLKTVYNIVDRGPGAELNLFNKIIFDDISEDMFITMMNLKYDLKTRKMILSNAGHNPMLLYKEESDSLEVISVKGVAIGFINDYNYKEKEFYLAKGDIAFMYTDGVIEAESETKELYGSERLKEVILNNKHKSLEELKEAILESISKFRGKNEQVDDITFVIMKCVD